MQPILTAIEALDFDTARSRLHALLSALPKASHSAASDHNSHPASAVTLDLEAALDRLSGEFDILLAAAENVIPQIETDHQALRLALDAADAEAASKVAHRLKGVCGIVGADKVASLAKVMVIAGRAGNLHACHDAFAILEPAIHELRAALQALLDHPERYRPKR